MLNNETITAMTTLEPLTATYAFIFPSGFLDEEVIQEINDYLEELDLNYLTNEETQDGEVFFSFEIEANRGIFHIESGVAKIIRKWAIANNNYAVSPK